MGAQDAHRGAQKTACCVCFEISDELYHKEGDGMLSHIVTGDETWVSHITPESKQQSLHWKRTGSPKRKKFKQTFSTRKIMCTIFWDRQGVFLIEFLPQGTTINSAVYCETLQKLRRAIQNKMLSATILLLHDNSRPHSAAQTQDLITSFKWVQMDHPPVQPRFGAKWLSPLPTPKEVPGWQAIWRWRWPERYSAEVANIAGGRILWGGYTKTCASLW